MHQGHETWAMNEWEPYAHLHPPPVRRQGKHSNTWPLCKPQEAWDPSPKPHSHHQANQQCLGSTNPSTSIHLLPRLGPRPLKVDDLTARQATCAEVLPAERALDLHSNAVTKHNHTRHVLFVAVCRTVLSTAEFKACNAPCAVLCSTGSMSTARTKARRATGSAFCCTTRAPCTQVLIAWSTQQEMLNLINAQLVCCRFSADTA